jgi:hypothetical protein
MLEVKKLKTSKEVEVDLADMWDGDTFLGTLTDIEGDEVTGLFLMAANTVVCLDSPESIFLMREDWEDVVISNFKSCKATVTISEVD